MADAPATRSDGTPLVEPTWGLGDAVMGWVVAQVFAVLVGGAIVGAAGYDSRHTDLWPLWLVAVTEVPLWVGLVGAPVYAARVKGNGLRIDFGLKARLVDVPVGGVVGLVSQLLLVPAVSWLWVVILRRHLSDLDDVAKHLADKAHHSVGGAVLLVLIVVVAAPIVEELFYRGLLLRSLERRVGDGWAVVWCGLIFGLSHFEPLQLPALAVFGMVLALLAQRSGRLGPSIFAHMAFNGVTVFALLAR
jgi:membrane protease YdiL (CAAX protease family)